MLLEGKQLGRYRILSLIGRGGMGEVYLAEDIQVNRQVAVKVIQVGVALQGNEGVADTLRMFLREASAIAKLDHPNILPLYDHGEEVIDGTHFAYMITPYRAEGALGNWLIKRAHDQKFPQLTLKQVAHLIQQASSALQYAHDHQIIHQDVKPANFLIRCKSDADEYPDLLLADFGIARLASTTSNASQNVRGTPTYMAPEQWAGKPSFASDQYALAVMAYELLTGGPPFQGNPMSMMYAHLQEQPKPPRFLNPQLPPAVDVVLLRALAKNPAERFTSVAAFAQAFQEALLGVDEGTAFRVLRSSPFVLQILEVQPNGDVYANLPLGVEEARLGVSGVLTLPRGQTMSIQIPSGALTGQVITLAGQGQSLGPGSAAGNLYLRLSVLETQSQISSVVNETAQTYRAPWLSTPANVNPPSIAPMEIARRSQSSLVLPSVTPQQPIVLPTANYAPPIGAFVSPSLPERPQSPHSPAVAILIILLVLFLLLGGGGIGAYRALTGGWPWSSSTSTPQANNGFPNPHITPTSALAPTATPTLAPTPTPTLAPTATPTPAPTPTPTAMPTPTPTSVPANPTLVVTPMSIGVPGYGPNCSKYVPPATCTVTLSEPANAQGSLNWSTSSGVNATFSPASGTLSPGQTIKVTITISICGGSWPLYFEAVGNTVTVMYSCS